MQKYTHNTQVHKHVHTMMTSTTHTTRTQHIYNTQHTSHTQLTCTNSTACYAVTSPTSFALPDLSPRRYAYQQQLQQKQEELLQQQYAQYEQHVTTASGYTNAAGQVMESAEQDEQVGEHALGQGQRQAG